MDVWIWISYIFSPFQGFLEFVKVECHPLYCNDKPQDFYCLNDSSCIRKHPVSYNV